MEHLKMVTTIQLLKKVKHCNDNQIKETNLNQEINYAYILFINFNYYYKVQLSPYIQLIGP